MRWLRSHIRFGSWSALFALTVQFALSFGHVHFDDSSLRSSLAPGALQFAVQAAATLAAWQRVDAVLGVGAAPEAGIPTELNGLLEQRQAARKAKDFKRADAIRDELKAKGWMIDDTPKGAKLKRL